MVQFIDSLQNFQCSCSGNWDLIFILLLMNARRIPRPINMRFRPLIELIAGQSGVWRNTKDCGINVILVSEERAHPESEPITDSRIKFGQGSGQARMTREWNKLSTESFKAVYFRTCVSNLQILFPIWILMASLLAECQLVKVNKKCAMFVSG